MNAPAAFDAHALWLATACLSASCLAFFASRRLWRRLHHHPLAHPLLIGPLPLLALVAIVDMPAADWRAGTQLLYGLLGPALVAIAVPVYRQRRTVLHALKPVLLAVFAGGLLAPAIAILLALPFSASRELLLSLAPKSVTSAVAYPVAEIAGGNAELAVGIVIVTGIVGALVAPLVFRGLGIRDARMQGLLLGVVAHAMGTARAIEMGHRQGAFAGVALALTGLATAVLLPVVLAVFVVP